MHQRCERFNCQYSCLWVNLLGRTHVVCVLYSNINNNSNNNNSNNNTNNNNNNMDRSLFGTSIAVLGSLSSARPAWLSQAEQPRLAPWPSSP